MNIKELISRFSGSRLAVKSVYDSEPITRLRTMISHKRTNKDKEIFTPSQFKQFIRFEIRFII